MYVFMHTLLGDCLLGKKCAVSEDTSIEPTSPTTPQRPRKTPLRHINTTHPAFITTLGSFLPNAQMESRPSDESISQVLQEI